MYSIVEIKGHQYRVSPGDIIDVQKTEGEVGSELSFESVLFVNDEGNVSVGQPSINGAKVSAKVIKQDRSRKKIVFRRLAGKYRKKNGHRQHFTSLLITGVSDGSGKDFKITTPSKRVEKHLN
ncbi:50S ribosomal protein L21 [Bacteriovoracaceae bacterium]|nr:50S ribosomal protein L21 [Bacteriovoracaceae bacterium]